MPVTPMFAAAYRQFARLLNAHALLVNHATRLRDDGTVQVAAGAVRLSTDERTADLAWAGDTLLIRAATLTTPDECVSDLLTPGAEPDPGCGLGALAVFL